MDKRSGPGYPASAVPEKAPLMLRRLYEKTMRLAEGPNALLALVLVSFAESSFFPIPPDALLIPMVLAQRERAFKLAAWCTAASVVGGIVGYAIGALLYDTLGKWIIDFYGYGQNMDAFRATYAEWGAWIILIKGLTPIPFKLVTIASGFAGYDFWLFVLLSIITRGIRFFLVAGLLHIYGEPIRNFLERRLELVTAGFAAVIVSGFLIVRYVV
jgi:membrane protein YqaA with SNARE-associated domain